VLGAQHRRKQRIRGSDEQHATQKPALNDKDDSPALPDAGNAGKTKEARTDLELFRQLLNGIAQRSRFERCHLVEARLNDQRVQHDCTTANDHEHDTSKPWSALAARTRLQENCKQNRGQPANMTAKIVCVLMSTCTDSMNAQT
jgi:hypothetical protein